MERLHTLTTKAEVRKLLDYLATVDEVMAFDTETTGLDIDAEIIGWSVCVDPEEAYYIVNSYWDVATQTLKDMNDTKALNEEAFTLIKSKQLIMHNAIFDCGKVEDEYKVELMDSVHTDTMVLSHLLDENRSNKLKDLGISVLGLTDATKEQELMHASVTKNGGSLTKECYELYKADWKLIAEYGAKDTILTMRLFIHFLPQLIEEGLFDFFYYDECMPLLRGPTYQMNRTGLKVDIDRLKKLGKELEIEIAEHAALIDTEIKPWVKDKYPGTKKTNRFNINAPQQLAWLVFTRLNNQFSTLTKGGRAFAKKLPAGRPPYTNKARATFIAECKAYRIPCAPCSGKGQRLDSPKPSKKTGICREPKLVMCKPCEGRGYKHPKPEAFMCANKTTLEPLRTKYKFVDSLLKMKKAEKLLGTYVNSILEKQRYGIIRPRFNQTGTDSGRYSSNNPNFQNIPRDDKRIKYCVIAREGRTFVGADFDQLEPRVFASVSGDFELQACFSSADDFYSVIGSRVFNKTGISLRKGAEGSFSVLYPQERQAAKEVGLASTYGVGAWQLAPKIKRDEAYTQSVIDDYFDAFPDVKQMQERQHAFVRKNGYVTSMFGRKRRIPEAKRIDWTYGKNTKHKDLPYVARTLLNLAVNFPIQSAGATIMNRAAIRFYNLCKEHGIDAKIVCQVHDELIVECAIEVQELVTDLLRVCMEETTELPGVVLKAKPKAAINFGELK